MRKPPCSSTSPHVRALVENELDGAHRAALAHHKDAGRADGLLAVEADKVEGDVRGEHDLLAVVQGVQALEARLEAARALKVEVRGGLAHLLLHGRDHVRAAPGEKVFDLPHVLGVLDSVDGAHADARPLAHVVVEAGPPRAGKRQVGHGRLVRAALQLSTAALPLRARGRADGHDLAQRVDGVARGVSVGVGAKVARPLAVVLARVLDGREHIRLGDGDVGVALVVLEVHVEVRVVLSDEVALEHEGLVLGAHHDVVERPHDLHHEGNLVAVVLERHVLAQAGAQVLGLAT